MKKISVRVEKNSFVFKQYERKINEANLNNTNVINTKNLVFSSEYIEQNSELVSAFLKIIALKNNINEARIDSISISQYALLIISPINVITRITFKENLNLNFEIIEPILKNPNIEFVNCYYMPEFLFNELTKYNNRVVELRNEIFTVSRFMECNSLKTYSDIYYKKKIVIDQPFHMNDMDDINNFLAINNHLEQLHFYSYYRSDFEYLLSKIPVSRVQGLRVYIYQNDMNEEILLKEIPYFKKLEKHYHFRIIIRYSKKYKEKNLLKQVNVQFLKFFLIAIVLSCLIYYVVVKFRTQKEEKHIESLKEEFSDILELEDFETEEEIKDTVEEIKQASAYSVHYQNIYQELLQKNSDTIGWLSIDGTNIAYPVVQSSDNDYYLNHSFDFQYSTFGWIYADYRNMLDMSDKNLIIYGHNVRGTNLMFATLKNLLTDDWFLNTDHMISFDIKGEEHKWQVFSIYTILDTNDYLKTEFGTDYAFMKYLNQEKSRSQVSFDVELKETDHILTLSTCFQDSSKRLVVHAKLVS